jgi:hypothetical protein
MCALASDHASRQRPRSQRTDRHLPPVYLSLVWKQSERVRRKLLWLTASVQRQRGRSAHRRSSEVAAAAAWKSGDAGIDRSLAVHEEPLHQLALADRRVSEQDDFDAVSRGGARQRGAIIGRACHGGCPAAPSSLCSPGCCVLGVAGLLLGDLLFPYSDSRAYCTEYAEYLYSNRIPTVRFMIDRITNSKHES